MVLGAAEEVRLVGAVRGRLRPVAPRDPALAGLVQRRLGRRVHREQPGLALNADVAHVGGGAGDDGDPAGGMLPSHPARPLGRAARLPGAAAGQEEERRPLAVTGRELLGPRPCLPIEPERDELLRGEPAEEVPHAGGRELREEVAEPAHGARPLPARATIDGRPGSRAGTASSASGRAACTSGTHLSDPSVRDSASTPFSDSKWPASTSPATRTASAARRASRST